MLPTDLNWFPDPPTPCPANNFGKGANYIPTDDERLEMLAQWDLWETAHPEDGTGSIYLEHYEERALEFSKSNPTTTTPKVFEDPHGMLVAPPVPQYTPTSTQVPADKRKRGRERTVPITKNTTQVRLILTVEQFQKFKDYAKAVDKSMSELLRGFIDSL